MGVALSDALTRLEARLQAPFGAYWTLDEGRYALTEAMRVWQALTGALRAEVEVPVAAGTVWFNAPRQLVTVSRMAVVGVPLTQYGVDELDAEFGDWEAATPTTVPKRWTSEGATLLAIHPPPTFDLVLTMEGPADVALLGKGPIDIGDEELTRLLAYAHNPYMTFKEHPPELASEAMARLAKAAGERNAELRNSDIYRRYAGMDKTIAGGQASKPEVGDEGTLGARG